MTPKLRVLIPSKSGKGYPPLTPCPVNSTEPTPLETDSFKGNIWVFVKGYSGDEKRGEGEGYFGKERGGMTYGIVVKGRFLRDVGGDDVLFGNVFENPIRDHLPWGTSIATKFMYFIDPVMECDIYADKPWALSPALATMSHLSLGSASSSDSKEVYVSEKSLGFLRESANGKDEEGEKNEISARRKWLGRKENREKVKLGKDVEVGMEFCNGLLDFNTLSATLPPPFTLSIPLLKYWDGQPVTYVCQRRPATKDQNPVGEEVFWSVAFEIVDEEARKKLEKKGGAVVRPGGGAEGESHSGEGSEKKEKEVEGGPKGEGDSDDVD
nr:uncharacterized protein CI109_005106 [Kwoniella shandongensis]KAA5526532.1 hypothetical protein CI109_005106 [Kwoniella shandongensis]